MMIVRKLALVMGLLVACQAPVHAFDFRAYCTFVCKSAWQNVTQLVGHVKSKISTKIAAVCAGSAAIAAGVYWYKQHLKKQKAIRAQGLEIYLQNAPLSGVELDRHVQQYWDLDIRLDFINKLLNECTPQQHQFVRCKEDIKNTLNNFFTPAEKKDQRYVSLKQQLDNLLNVWIELGANNLAGLMSDALASVQPDLRQAVGTFKWHTWQQYSAQEYICIAHKVLDDYTWTDQHTGFDWGCRVGREIIDVLLYEQSAEVRRPLEIKLLLRKPLSEIKNMVLKNTLALAIIVSDERFSLDFLKEVCSALLADTKMTFGHRVQKAKHCWNASPERIGQMLEYLFSENEKQTDQYNELNVYLINNRHAAMSGAPAGSLQQTHQS